MKCATTGLTTTSIRSKMVYGLCAGITAVWKAIDLANTAENHIKTATCT